ncbi:hypothetical protein ASF14_20235 [Sphingomonas sp. Leaf257]|nr:hypothetical protein ASF14_20235 [Sphingomonas sp. Leaf257]
MHLQVRDVDHQMIWCPTFGRQSGNDAVEHPPIRLQRMNWFKIVLAGRKSPAQAVPDHEDDATDDPPLIHARHAMRQRKYGSIRRICSSVSQNRLLISGSFTANKLTPPQPRKIFDRS